MVETKRSTTARASSRAIKQASNQSSGLATAVQVTVAVEAVRVIIPGVIASSRPLAWSSGEAVRSTCLVSQSRMAPVSDDSALRRVRRRGPVLWSDGLCFQ